MTENFPDFLVVKKSTIEGKGIFTNKNINSGDYIFTFEGKIMDVNEVHEIGGTLCANACRFSKEKYLSPQNTQGNFLNHSCQPNSFVKKINDNLSVFALCDIPEGEELVMDYSTIIANDDDWTLVCNCGEKNCRGVIGKFNELPLEIQKNYLEANTVPSYIIEI